MNARQAAHPLWGIHLYATSALILLALTVGAPASAQYTAPGTPIPTRHQPSKDEFQDKIKESPWKAGRLALSPWLGLRDFSVVTDLNRQEEDRGEDLTLTVGAGLRGYLPAGSKILFTAHALPEYVWWQDREEKRGLNGRYGLGVFGFFNRLTLELSQRRVEQQSFFSSEIQALTSSRNDVSTLHLDLELTPNLSLFGIATRQEYRNEETEIAVFSALDRTDESGSIGVRYQNPRGWTLELGFLDVSSDFATGARNLSNSGSAPQVAIGLDRQRIGFRLDLSFEDREADGASEFGRFNETTGSFAVLWQPSQRVGLLSYIRRAQAYSTNDSFTFFLEERQGARVHFKFDQVRLGLFGEIGEDDFEATSSGLFGRIDDVTAYGAELEVKLREVGFSVRATRSDYDSDFDRFDRDVTRVEFGVELEAISRFTSRLIDKLSLGSPGTAW